MTTRDEPSIPDSSDGGPPAAEKVMSGGGLSLVLIGIALSLLGGQFDGFFGGALQGAGVALVLFGAYVLGARWRRPQGSDQTWLPSRDGDS